MSLEAIHREIHDARATGYQHIVHIRVTTDALQGSPVTVPITPERARAIGRLMMVQGHGVVADPMDYETRLELLVHPQDYSDLLKDVDLMRYGVQIGEPMRIMGIPVSR